MCVAQETLRLRINTARNMRTMTVLASFCSRARTEIRMTSHVPVRPKTDQIGTTQVKARYPLLIIKTLVNSVCQGPATDPLSETAFDAAKRAIGMDRPRMGHILVGLRYLSDLVQRTPRDASPGDHIYNGVRRGGLLPFDSFHLGE